MPEAGSILLVEDDLNDAELALRDFKTNNLGNKVIVVRDGIQALDYLLFQGIFASRVGKNPMLVLLDLNMPRLDGWEVLRQIRENPQLNRIPVAILVSSAQHLVRTEENPYFDATIVKPITFRKMAESTRQLALSWTKITGHGTA